MPKRTKKYAKKKSKKYNSKRFKRRVRRIALGVLETKRLPQALSQNDSATTAERTISYAIWNQFAQNLTVAGYTGSRIMHRSTRVRSTVSARVVGTSITTAGFHLHQLYVVQYVLIPKRGYGVGVVDWPLVISSSPIKSRPTAPDDVSIFEGAKILYRRYWQINVTAQGNGTQMIAIQINGKQARNWNHTFKKNFIMHFGVDAGAGTTPWNAEAYLVTTYRATAANVFDVYFENQVETYFKDI